MVTYARFGQECAGSLAEIMGLESPGCAITVNNEHPKRHDLTEAVQTLIEIGLNVRDPQAPERVASSSGGYTSLVHPAQTPYLSAFR